MSVKVRTKSGKTRTLLNPSEKAQKFAYELSYDVKATNEGKQIIKRNGNIQELTPEQKAYRAGYSQSRTDSSRAYCHNKGIKSKSNRRYR